MSRLVELQRIVIPDPDPYIMTSASQRRSFGMKKKKQKIPAKYFTDGSKRTQLKPDYSWKNFSGTFYLVDKDGKKICINPNKVGKPKFYKVTGQEFTSTNVHFGLRMQIMDEKKLYFKEYIEAQLKPITIFPVLIKWYYYYDMQGQVFDLDNIWWWWKVFGDTLHDNELLDNPIFPDDSYKYITLPGNAPRLIPSDHNKFVWVFYRDDHPKILGHELWKKHRN